MASSTEVAELTYLAARCKLILDALADHEPDAQSLSAIRDVLEETAEKRNVRGLRTIRRDLLDMMKVLPAPARAALQVRLDAQGHDDPASRAR